MREDADVGTTEFADWCGVVAAVAGDGLDGVGDGVEDVRGVSGVPEQGVGLLPGGELAQCKLGIALACVVVDWLSAGSARCAGGVGCCDSLRAGPGAGSVHVGLADGATCTGRPVGACVSGRVVWLSLDEIPVLAVGVQVRLTGRSRPGRARWP